MPTANGRVDERYRWLQRLAARRKGTGKVFSYRSFAYSAVACFRIGIPGSSSFESD